MVHLLFIIDIKTEKLHFYLLIVNKWQQVDTVRFDVLVYKSSLM